MSSAPVVLAVQNDPTDPPLLVGEWLAEAGIDVRVVRAVDGEPVPERVPEGVHGVLPLGGAMGALDDHVAPWLPAERALLADAVARGIPVLGLCLGGQLLAAALGGRVDRAPACEIGLSFVERTPDGDADPVMAALPAPRVPATQWHQDHVATLPEGASVLLANEVCVQGYRVGASAYGLQLHPEVDGELFAWWAGAADPADEALVRSGIDLGQAAAGVRAAQEDLVAAWRPVTLAWARLVREAAG